MYKQKNWEEEWDNLYEESLGLIVVEGHNIEKIQNDMAKDFIKELLRQKELEVMNRHNLFSINKLNVNNLEYFEKHIKNEIELLSVKITDIESSKNKIKKLILEQKNRIKNVKHDLKKILKMVN